MIFEQREHPLRMIIVNDSSHVFCISAIIPELFYVSTHLRDELFAQISLNYDIVRSYTCLAGIHKSSKSDLLSSEVNIGGLVDDDGTLTA